MKNILILAITIYQKFISPLLHQLLGQKNLCRYEVSCSEFAKDVITKKGVITGSRIAIARLISCQPFTKPYANI